MSKSENVKTTPGQNEFRNSDLEALIGYNLKRAYVLVQNDFRQSLGEGELSPRAFAALSLVVRNPKSTQSELARALGVERSGMVAIIDDLEKRGLLERVEVPGDRRVQALLATKTGRNSYETALASVVKHEEKLFGNFSDDERGVLLALLKRFRADQENISQD